MNTSVNNAMSLINASVNASINSLLTKINNANSSINSIDASVKWIIEVYQPELERTWADIFYFLNASMGIANGSINRIEQLISALDMQTTNDRLDAIEGNSGLTELSASVISNRSDMVALSASVIDNKNEISAVTVDLVALSGIVESAITSIDTIDEVTAAALVDLDARLKALEP
jgi:hypothetical protein